MKNQERLTYIGLGALIAVIVLFFLGRLRVERYEEGKMSEEELIKFLSEEATSAPAESAPAATGPAPMGDGADSDSDSE